MWDDVPESIIQELPLEAKKAEVPKVEVVACDVIAVEDWCSWN